ncbi:phage tail sheath subtilisin-like domain-containing protein [Parasegetibacter sp. MAH-26]|uniref:Phage tail sheath subtilisin-like domain-containing protein n=2 Tax=Pinibacter aurantiacus TaxID=2851599 RepID=A0A9E2SD68_9BACT|nr:phage tail sheath subtilisin-like domain-containing protein [Pinibacter aurantiacus]
MMDYVLYFGGADKEKNIKIDFKNVKDEKTGAVTDTIITASNSKPSSNVMYYAMQLFFANGGGPCYIVSTGSYDDSANAAGAPAAYSAALGMIAKEDEPTLLVFPDAPFILSQKDYYSLMNDSLAQAEKLGDRFAIIDVVDVKNAPGDSADAFRNAGVGVDDDHAKYGAAYYPYLNTTTITYEYDDANIALSGDVPAALPAAAGAPAAPAAPEPAAAAAPAAEGGAPAAPARAPRPGPGPIAGGAKFDGLTSDVKNKIRQKIKDLSIVLTPAAAIAGVYANVDNTRGVWKAPANVGLNYVSGPVVKITDDDQDSLNIDVTAGKSINAIRAFVGKGTKVWGARTLSGNSNDWRYINVRRFFNMVEESVKKSTYWAVFEPNDINTWTKVRAMIENYLLLKWKDGALAGVKPDDAYFVRVGLGQTMTAVDVLEGRMNVEIGLAVVRPAEFIILKFSQKLQVS